MCLIPQGLARGRTGEIIRRWGAYERSAAEMLHSSITFSGTRSAELTHWGSLQAGIISLNRCYYNKEVFLKASPPGLQTAGKFLVFQKQPKVN